jgi:hypothetical protein
MVVLLHSRTAQLEERAQQLCSALIDSFTRCAALLQRSKLEGSTAAAAAAAGEGAAAGAGAEGTLEQMSDADLVMVDAEAVAAAAGGSEGLEDEGIAHAVAQVRCGVSCCRTAVGTPCKSKCCMLRSAGTS